MLQIHKSNCWEKENRSIKVNSYSMGVLFLVELQIEVDETSDGEWNIEWKIVTESRFEEDFHNYMDIFPDD